MSRVGKSPIPVPSGVDVTVKGPKGTLSRTVPGAIAIRQDGDTLLVERPDDERQTRALHGLVRSLVNNMVVGVSQEFSKELEIIGTGYRAALQGTTLDLSLGFSHPVKVDAPEAATNTAAPDVAPNVTAPVAPPSASIVIGSPSATAPSAASSVGSVRTARTGVVQKRPAASAATATAKSPSGGRSPSTIGTAIDQRR